MSRPDQRSTGRPSRLSPHLRDRLTLALRQGNHRSTAARYAGIGDSTFHRWMTDPRPEYREFRTLVERAEAEAEVAIVGNLVAATKRDHRAALSWLERRAPERWRLGDRLAWETDLMSGAPEPEEPPMTSDFAGRPETVITIPAAKITAFSRMLRGLDPDDTADRERLSRFCEKGEDDEGG
jgi:hypothetical protein